MTSGDDKLVAGKCCRWMELALHSAEQSPFSIHTETGMVEVVLGHVEPHGWYVKSVLYCPFCGHQMSPWNPSSIGNG